MRKRMAEKRERNKTRGMMIGVAQKQAATMDYTKRPTSATAQQLQQELEISDREVFLKVILTIYKPPFQRHQQMQKFLSTSEDDSLQRRRPGQPSTERQIIAAQTEGLSKVLEQI
jgi:hypothetical protein